MMFEPYAETEKLCSRCKEMWPPDEEFYRPGKLQCRACEYEVREMTPSRSKDARLKEAERSKQRRSARKLGKNA
jgi:uncharacterized Zn finger protein (UPF0148 family)